jgi:hypothetical protein
MQSVHTRVPWSSLPIDHPLFPPRRSSSPAKTTAMRNSATSHLSSPQSIPRSSSTYPHIITTTSSRDVDAHQSRHSNTRRRSAKPPGCATSTWETCGRATEIQQNVQSAEQFSLIVPGMSKFGCSVDAANAGKSFREYSAMHETLARGLRQSLPNLRALNPSQRMQLSSPG